MWVRFPNWLHYIELTILQNGTFCGQVLEHIPQRLGLGWTRGLFFLKDMSSKCGTGGLVFLYANGEILNTTADFKNIAKIQYKSDLFWQ